MLVSVTTDHCLICEHGRRLGIDSKASFVEVALTFLKIFRLFSKLLKEHTGQGRGCGISLQTRKIIRSKQGSVNGYQKTFPLKQDSTVITKLSQGCWAQVKTEVSEPTRSCSITYKATIQIFVSLMQSNRFIYVPKLEKFVNSKIHYCSQLPSIETPDEDDLHWCNKICQTNYIYLFRTLWPRQKSPNLLDSVVLELVIIVSSLQQEHNMCIYPPIS